jgi:hypothetical protein
MFQQVGGLILGVNKGKLVHSELVHPILKYRFYPNDSCQSSFKFNVALACVCSFNTVVHVDIHLDKLVVKGSGR